MADVSDSPDSIETMAFQVLLQKMVGLEQHLGGLERSMQSIPPLLAKIIAHLEAQTAQPEVPVATYAQLYPELEGQEPAEAGALLLPDIPPPPAVPAPRRRVWHWFLREV
jgi:hypothetical protein